MTFAPSTAHADAFHRSLEDAARQVAAFTTRMVRGFWEHYMGGPGGPLVADRGLFREKARPDRKRVAADRRRRKETRRLHARLRRAGRDRGGKRR